MSRYTIHTISFYPQGDVELIVHKNKESFSFEIKSEVTSLISKKDNIKSVAELKSLLNSIYTPDIFFTYVDSDNYYEVVLFQQEKIFYTNWTYNELSDFDKNLYKDHSYSIIKLIRDNKLSYNFKSINTHPFFEINIDLKSDLLKSLNENKIDFYTLKSTPVICHFVDTLEKINPNDNFIVDHIKDNKVFTIKIFSERLLIE